MTNYCKVGLIAAIAIAAALVVVITWLSCTKSKQQKSSEKHVTFDKSVLEHTTAKPTESFTRPAKEGFISSGVDGAFYNPRTNAIQGDSLYSNQMIQNGQNWKSVTDTAIEKNIASDGFGQLGAGNGDGFQSAYKGQKKLEEAWENVRNGFMSNEEFDKLKDDINISTAPQSDTSLLNRGNQNCGKMNILPNKLVCVVDEKYLGERDKNYDVYKTNTIVHCQGYDIDTNNVGRALSGSHFSKYLLNDNGHRKITSAGASTGGLKVIEDTDQDEGYMTTRKEVENFKSKWTKEGFGKAGNSTNGYATAKNSDGGVWYRLKKN